MYSAKTLCLHVFAPCCLGWVLMGMIANPTLRAQETPTADQQQETDLLASRVETFFRTLTDKALDPETAVREIIGKGPLKDRNDEINKLIEQTLTLDQRYGTYTGHEQVASKLVGEDLAFFRYLYKGDRFPVVWYFTFYRPAAIGSVQREWMLISLRFDAKIEALER
jgi:hypothetical protein